MNQTAPPAPFRSKFFYWVAALLLASACLYYSLRGINWQQVRLTLETTELGYLGLALLTSTISLFMRALRWRVLLRSGGPVRFATAFWATCGGYFGNNYLPARAGELIRTLMVDAEAGLGRTFVLTTALSERLVDAITLVAISSIVLLILPSHPGWYASAAKPFALIGICSALAIAILPKLERFWHGLLARVPAPQRVREKLRDVLEQILLGLKAFHDGRRLLTYLALTAVIWFMDALGTVLGTRSVGMSLNFSMAFLLITGLGLGSALPSTPGYVGIYQFAAVSVLGPFGFSRSVIIAYTLLLQVLQYLSTGIWGMFALLRFRKSQRDGTNADSVGPPVRRV